MNYNNNFFRGPFKDILPKFIDYQKSQGYNYGTSIIYRFRQMDDFFYNNGYNTIHITEEMYNKWISYKDGEKYTNQMRRIIAINTFSKYLINNGYKNIYINSDRIKIKNDFVPYIFSNEEIDIMFRKIDYLINNKENKNYKSFKVMFSLYYACGLRLSEVINLKINDINFDTGVIKIFDSKNNVSRLIVCSDSIKKILHNYYNLFYDSDNNNYLFRNNANNKFCKSSIYDIFNEVLNLSNIPKRINCLGPRIHDLRHTFAVKSLQQMTSKGFDLYTSLPILCKYLGHKSIKETEYYLRLTENYFDEINKLNTKYLGNMFEVKDNERY